MSGLIKLKFPAGPRELNAANWSAWLVNTVAGNGIAPVAVGLANTKALMASPWTCERPKAGTVVAGTCGIKPVAPALFTTTTAKAPAALALFTLIENEQVPRKTT